MMPRGPGSVTDAASAAPVPCGHVSVLDVVAPRRLGHPFRWLLGSSWVANLGDGTALAAGPLLVAAQTRSPLLIALAALLQRLPWLLFGLYAGVLADRLDRRRIVIVCNLVRAGVITALVASIVTDAVNIAVVLVVMFLLGTAETFVDVTTGTLLPMVVEPRDLGVGNARLMAGFLTMNQLAGPPLGALLFALGAALPFVTQAVCVVLAVVLVAKVALPPPPPAPTESHLRREIADGFRWTWGNPAVRTLTLTIVTFNVTFGAAWSMLVLFALERVDLGEAGFGWLAGASALGGILGTLSYDWLERHVTLGNIMRAGLIIETFTHLGFALTRTAWVALAIMFVFGAHAFIWGTTSRTVRMRAVPREFQGRVGSLYMVGVFGGIVVGQLIGGVLGDLFGITAPFWFAFVGSAIILVLIWPQLDHIAHTDAETPEPLA